MMGLDPAAIMQLVQNAMGGGAGGVAIPGMLSGGVAVPGMPGMTVHAAAIPIPFGHVPPTAATTQTSAQPTPAVPAQQQPQVTVAKTLSSCCCSAGRGCFSFSRLICDAIVADCTRLGTTFQNTPQDQPNAMNADTNTATGHRQGTTSNPPQALNNQQHFPDPFSNPAGFATYV